ncbi:MAG: glycosyltransferase family 4 protein [Bacteroidales bacterium]|nr:glycosyltransferase family 4 protein [Bacteroidales bacterium]
MIIGYDAKRAFCNHSGLGNYSRMLIDGVAHGDKTSALLLYTPKIKQLYHNYFQAEDNVSVVLPEKIWRFVPALWRTIGDYRHMKRNNVQIFHGLSHELPYCLPMGVKKVVSIHDLIAFRYPHYFSKLDSFIYQHKQKHACKVADMIVAISEQTKQDLINILKIPENRIKVIYQSVDSIFWNWIKNTDKQTIIEQVRQKYKLPQHYILCVGTVEERKNQDTVIQAMAQLPADVSLVVLGRHRGDYIDILKNTIKKYNLTYRVYFLPNIAFDDFPALYTAAHASVYMSYFEGFGIPILEAMCCDTPVVTANVSSMPEVGGDAVLYATPNDVNAIANHLNKILSDENLRQQMIGLGQQQRLRFTPDIIASQMLEAYRTLLV